MGFFDGGPVKIAINIFCALILYEIFYIIYFITATIHQLIIWRSKEVVSILFYRILFYGLTFFAWVCANLIILIGTVFLMLYLVWKVLNKIGLGIFINGIPPFNDCVSTGLFPFFDKLFDILWGSEAFGLKIRGAGIASSDFLKTFMKEAFGLVFEGYELDDEYLTAAFNVFLFNNMYADDLEKCFDAKQKFLEITKQKTPVIKITYDAPVERQPTETENINIRNCIRENTVEIPNDANTIERLKLIFSNAVAKQKCYLDIKNHVGDCSAKSLSCMISDMEHTAKNIGDNINLASATSFSNSVSSASKYYDNSVDKIEKSKKG